MASIAACLIARNEERSILVTLDSLRGAVDEIVIGIDPTSSDRTREVVTEWLTRWDSTGERWKVVEGKSVEEEGFAEARNAALAHVTADWVLIIDSDEILPSTYEGMFPWGADGTWVKHGWMNHAALRDICNRALGNVDLLALTMLMYADDGTFQSHFQGERLIRGPQKCLACKGSGVLCAPGEVKDLGEGKTCEACNGTGVFRVKFVRPMHNAVINARSMGQADVVIVHNRKHRSEEERTYRSAQRVRMAEKWFLNYELQKNPEDSRSQFYLAGTYNDAGMWEKAAEWFERYLNNPHSKFESERYQATVFLVRDLMQLPVESEEEHRENLRKAQVIGYRESVNDWQRAELPLLLGEVAHELGEYERAVTHFKEAALRTGKVGPHFVEAASHTWMPHSNMAQAYYAIGDREAAEQALKAAQDRGAPEGLLSEIFRFGIPSYPPVRKLAVFIDRGDDKFLKPLLEEWGKRYQVMVVTEAEVVKEVLEKKPDACWFEWAGPLLVEATKHPHRCRTIVRVHGYELHSGFIPQVDWRKVDHVIFVARYLRDLAIQQAPMIGKTCLVHLVPGGIDVGRFVVGEGKQGNRLAMAGYINHKKNPGLALQILYAARQKWPERDFHLHVAGTFQESRMEVYLRRLAYELGLTDVVHFEPWQQDMSAWFADKDYILSTSIEESLHYALAEGMAAGLKPIIHCWESARDWYPDQYIFRTVEEAIVMLEAPSTAEDRKQYREWIAENLSFEMQQKDIDLILARPTICVPSPDTQDWRFELAAGDALATLGFAPASADRADILLFCSAHAGRIKECPKRNPRQVRVLWNAEQIVGDDDHATPRRERVIEAAKLVDHVVVSSPNAKAVLEAAGIENVKVVFQGGARDVWRPRGPVEKTINVGFYGYMNERRQRILEEVNARLEEEDLGKVQVLATYDHAQLAQFVQRCKVVLNLHCTDEPNVETRLAECMAAGTFVVSEPLPEEADETLGKFCASPHDDETVAEVVVHWLKDDLCREEIAKQSQDWIWNNLTTGHSVEALLEACGLRWGVNREDSQKGETQ